jgi:hypothetical protein
VSTPRRPAFYRYELETLPVEERLAYPRELREAS